MLAVTMDIFEAPMIERMRRFAMVTNQTVGEAIRSRAPALARYLATATMPIAGLSQDGSGNPKGFTKAAETAGKRSVSRDIGHVYKSPNSIAFQLAHANGSNGKNMAKGFVKYIKTGDLQKAKALLVRAKIPESSLTIVQWDGGETHKKVRNGRGRVAAGRNPSITTDAVALKKYSDMRRKNVGFAKGGWINAARNMGGKLPLDTPVWVSRHNSPGHGMDMTNDPTHPRYSLTNEVDYLSTILSESYLIRATESFDKSMRKEINIVCAKIAKEASL